MIHWHNLVAANFSAFAVAALAALAEGGYAVRHIPNQGLGHALRITIGTAQDMDAITAILRKLLGEAA